VNSIPPPCMIRDTAMYTYAPLSNGVQCAIFVWSSGYKHKSVFACTWNCAMATRACGVQLYDRTMQQTVIRQTSCKQHTSTTRKWGDRSRGTAVHGDGDFYFLSHLLFATFIIICHYWHRLGVSRHLYRKWNMFGPWSMGAAGTMFWRTAYHLTTWPRL
jgi:hypothetical protein